MLKATDLSVSYGHINAVRNVNFHVDEGEIVALIGSNGAGKTTILKTISGLLRAKAGQITCQGKDITKSSPSEIVKSGIVHVPEGRQVFSSISVEDNLWLGGYQVKDKNLIKERIEYVHQLFPILKERASQKAGSLSGGEQQMLAIGRGLISHPKYLLLDEPSLGLAPIIVQQVFRVIQELKETGITILLVEQNAVDALDISDRAYIIESGEIALEGKSSEIAASEDVQRIYLGGV
ncbi:MAG: ABC transporter ATP-binding protein [Firmicutes bacterium]|nr:ABC transporter ATP-binding protein [Bacillota bacterium]